MTPPRGSIAQFTPSFTGDHVMSIVSKLWNNSPKAVVQAVANKVAGNKPNPAWTKVTSGPLAGGQLFIDASSFAGWQEMADGRFDAFIYKELAGANLKDAVVWDIGAHFGYHSFSFASLVGDGGHVYSFEPNPFNGTRFKMHLAQNPTQAARISLNPLALSDTEGQATFVFSEDVDGSSSSGSHLESAIVPLAAGTYARFKHETVECLTIDSFIAKTGARIPQYMKIDVEGAEMLVLRGGNSFFAQHRPVIFMEVHNILLMHAVHAFFIELGYSVKVLDEENSTLSKCFIVARPR
jgi:FkbM family methyltransferase